MKESLLVEEYRRKNPQSRVVSILKYSRNGATVKQKTCVLCGASGPSWCGRWAKTKAAKEWEEKHIQEHTGAGEICA